jgi:hypothetical protein
MQESQEPVTDLRFLAPASTHSLPIGLLHCESIKLGVFSLARLFSRDGACWQYDSAFQTAKV